MRYRVATVDDLSRLAPLRWEFRTESGEVPIDDEATFTQRYLAFVREGVQSGQWTYWLAETAEGEIVAHMAICTVRSIPRPSRLSDQWGYLTDCYTRYAFRDQGIGRQLLANVAAWAAARDLEMLLVWPSDRSRTFYARAGFSADDEVRVLRLRDYDASPNGPSFASLPRAV